ncbi:MAG: GNAT family N-acetyltransferase [Oscillospiraceae bacterium]|nr:GNAT family N-acetyltransferase [Oscillospiraceae bacterium]
MTATLTARLCVRDPKPADLEGWHRLFSDTRNMRFLEHLQTHSPEESRASLQSAIDAAHTTPRVKYFFAVELRRTGELIGSIGFMTEQVGNDMLGGVGWFLLPEYQGRGYATEAFRALIPRMFDDWGVTLVDAGCDAANPASERVMRKGGLALTKRDGNRLQYQLSKKDWEMHRQT